MKYKNLLFVLFLVFFFTGISYAFKKEKYLMPSGKKTDVLTGAVLVKYKDSAPEKSNIKKSKSNKGMEKLGVNKIKIPADKSISEVLNELNERDDVAYAEPIYIRKAFRLPSEYANEAQLKSRQWGLEKIGAPETWDEETGSGVVVAVLDTGIDLDHPDLAENIWDNSNSDISYKTYQGTDSNFYEVIYDTHGWDYVNDDNDPDDDDITISAGHGTHCAGIIAARANNAASSVVGVSWYNKLMAVKVLDSFGSGFSDDVVEGIIYAADRGAKVISMSFGGDIYSNFEQEAIDYAYSKGCVIVAAAGNQGSSQLLYPAAYNNVISVGAVDINDDRAAFSNYGSSLDIVAPGVDIYSTVIGGYGTLSGTSMACPFVAGMASVVISLWDKGGNTSWTPSEVENIIFANCEDVNSNVSAGWDSFTGYGRIDGAEIMNFINAGIVNIEDDKFVVYPNPFNPRYQQVNIVFSKSFGQKVKKTRIYSLDGQEVRALSGSNNAALWDGRNNDGELCATGLYFYCVETDEGNKKGKITLIK